MISEGRYLAIVEDAKVKRARAGHAYVEWHFRILRRLSSFGNEPGSYTEAILSGNSKAYENDIHDAGRAVGLTSLSIPEDESLKHRGELGDAAVEKRKRHEHDELLRVTLAPFVGKVAVIEARTMTARGYRQRDPFVVTTWFKPTPVDLCNMLTLPEALALLGRVWRMLKDDTSRRRADDVLELLEQLEIPR